MKFTLELKDTVQLRYGQEEQFLYKGEDGTQVQFHAGRAAWTWVLTDKTTANKAVAHRLIAEFCEMTTVALGTGACPDAAVQTLTVK